MKKEKENKELENEREEIYRASPGGRTTMRALPLKRKEKKRKNKIK